MKNKSQILLSFALSIYLLFHSLSLAAQTRINTNIQNLLKDENIHTAPTPAQESSEEKQVHKTLSQELVKNDPRLEKAKKLFCGNFDLISGAFKACKEAGSSNETCDKYLATHIESRGDSVTSESLSTLKETVNALIAKECPTAKTSCECMAQYKKSDNSRGICPLPNECEVSCDLSKEDISKLTQFYADRREGAVDPALKDLAIKVCGEEEISSISDSQILNTDTPGLQQSLISLEKDQKLEENTNTDSNDSGMKINHNMKNFSSGIRYQASSMSSLTGLREIDPLCLCLKKHHCPVVQCQSDCALSSAELYIISKYEKTCKSDKNSSDCKAIQDRYSKICEGKSPTRCLNDAMCFTPEDKVCENNSTPPSNLMKEAPPNTEALDARGVIEKTTVDENLLEGGSKCSMQTYPHGFSLFQVLGFFVSLLASSLWMAILRTQKK